MVIVRGEMFDTTSIPAVEICNLNGDIGTLGVEQVVGVSIVCEIIGGRFWRKIGLKSSGLAALSLSKEYIACLTSLSVIH